MIDNNRVDFRTCFELDDDFIAYRLLYITRCTIEREDNIMYGYFMYCTIGAPERNMTSDAGAVTDGAVKQIRDNK